MPRLCGRPVECIYTGKKELFHQQTLIRRHALPPGFILKSEKKAMEEQREKISIEDLIEKERAALGSNVTKVCHLDI